MTVDEKRKLELKTMYQIIGIYCHNKHHTPKGQLCEACEQVWEYAEHRKIREIMRYGGPRMLFVSPIQVSRHMYLEWKDKKRG